MCTPLLNFADQHAGETLALATLVRARGSTYRRPGARMFITAAGAHVGTLSGGCLERDVAEQAGAMLAEGRPRLLTYDTRLTLGCHGVVEILLEPMPPAVLQALRGGQAQRVEVELVTVFASAERALGTYLSPECPELINGESVFFDTVPPAVRLAVAGDGHDAAPLVRIARELGWSVLPFDATTELVPDAWTAAVVMNHHFGRDLQSLHALLPLRLPYLGLLGPRRRREQLLAALAENGPEPSLEELETLRSPAGLDLGGETPEEVALSILAEVRAVLSGREGRALRERRTGIHESPALARA